MLVLGGKDGDGGGCAAHDESSVRRARQDAGCPEQGTLAGVCFEDHF